MSKVFVNLPVSAGNGVGAGQSVATMGRFKTVTVGGTFNGTVILEVSLDGGTTWGQILATTATGKFPIEVSAQQMRVRRSGVPTVAPGTPNVDVGGLVTGASFEALAVPAGNGNGAGTDISALGQFSTVTCVGTYKGQVLIQISEDNSAWETCFAFDTSGGVQSKIVLAQFVRVRRVGVPSVAPGAPVVNFGACDDPAYLGAQNIWTKSQTVAQVTLTDAAEIDVDASLSNNFELELTGENGELQNPTNTSSGVTLNFAIRQDGTGGHTLSFDTAYKFPGGTAPTITTDAGAEDMISCYVRSASNILCSFVQDES